MPAAIGQDLTLGRRYKEMHLPLDVETYVLGVVGEDRCIVAPEPGPRGSVFSSSSIPKSRARRR
jgi:hypothetical protein